MSTHQSAPQSSAAQSETAQSETAQSSPAPAPTGSSTDDWIIDQAGKSNSTFPWDEFDSLWYLEHNYATVRDDDHQIMELIAKFFTAKAPRKGAAGLDVGTGTNLYPMLAMLPFCDQITLREHAASNVRWLESEIASYSRSWDAFWKILSHGRPPYEKIADPRQLVRFTATVEKGSIFHLEQERWDIGTMFFVAESITALRREFVRATRRFIGALKRRAPFAAAFMKRSQGYNVGKIKFPAVAVNEDDIRRCLENITHELTFHQIHTTTPLRDGYEGMILVTGRAGRK